jgi:Ca-activated chloride channel family protein
VAADRRTYPLKSAQIEAHAEGGLAATTLIQTYDNPYDEPLEVFYTLPLPADGAVTGYTIRLGDRVIHGEVHKRAVARERYRRALFEGRTAALIEQDRADTFTQSLGSIPPRQAVEVKIEILQQLAFIPADEDARARWEYRFPTVPGIRYEGAKGRVPDAERLDIDRVADGTAVRLTVKIHIADGVAEEIRPLVPGCELDFEPEKSGVAATLRGGMKLDRDLVVRWSAVSGLGSGWWRGKGSYATRAGMFS